MARERSGQQLDDLWETLAYTAYYGKQSVSTMMDLSISQFNLFTKALGKTIARRYPKTGASFGQDED